MGFYNLSKEQRQKIVDTINLEITADIKREKCTRILNYFSDEDTYIRKTSYLAIGKLYKSEVPFREKTLQLLNSLIRSENEKVRQTAINAAGEVGIMDFCPIEHLLELGLFDPHHSVRNAVIGSIKKIGEKNPVPVLTFAKRFLKHDDKEIRREICHGIELRGRTHPQDTLPFLKELQHDKTARVRNTLIHVLGQISYKKGCLETVVQELKNWKNKDLVANALGEIIDVHDRYKGFAAKTQDEVKKYIENNF